MLNVSGFLRQLCTAQRFSSMIIVRLLSTRAFLVGLHHRRSLLGRGSRRCYRINLVTYLNWTPGSEQHSPLTLATNPIWEVSAFSSCASISGDIFISWGPILTLWGHGQSKSLFLQLCHSHVMREPKKKWVDA